MAKKDEKAVEPTVDVEAMLQAKIDAMLAAAEQKANEIIAAAEAKASGKTAVSEETKKLNEAGEEYVTVKLFKDNTRYVDDVYVSVNGENCRIPRGVPCRIKKKFWDVLEQSDMQDAKTAQMMTEKADEFANESRARNI